MIQMTYHTPDEEHTYINDILEDDHLQHMLKLHETRFVVPYSLDGEILRQYAIKELQDLIETIKGLDMKHMVAIKRKK